MTIATIIICDGCTHRIVVVLRLQKCDPGDDKGKHNHPAWKPVFEGYEPVAAWLAAHRPDVLLMIYNDLNELNRQSRYQELQQSIVQTKRPRLS